MVSLLKGKVAIITGSSSGIGEAIAILFAKRGANVTLCGRDKDRLKSVLDKGVVVSGGNQKGFLTFQGDLNDLSVREQLIEQTVKKFGHLDILVANAGAASANTSFLDYTEEMYNTIFDTNLKSVFFLIQKAVPHLEKTKGNIVNISSTLSSVASPYATVYSLSKAALDHLTRCLAVDLGPKGIRVNSVNPGYFPTRILRNYGDVDKANAFACKIERVLQPLKDRTGVIEDVAQAVGFLVSDDACFITGVHIKVDGGRSFNGPTKYLPDDLPQ